MVLAGYPMARLRRWKMPLMLALLFAAIATLDAALHLLRPVSQQIHDALASASAEPLSVRSVLATGAYYLWLSTKKFALAATVIGFTFFVEMKLSRAEREKKDYLLAALVQTSFIYIAFLATRALAALIPPLPDPLFSLTGVDGSIERTAATFAAVGAYLFLTDVLLYWTHRAHHHVPILWKFHAVHHCSRDLDALHNYVHPVELLIRYLTIVLPLSLIIRLDWQFYPVFAFLVVQNQLSHMNVPLNFGPFGLIFVDNRHHFIHHSSDPSHFNQNFAGIFTFTDRIFGTFRASTADLPGTGFSREQIPSTLTDFILARKASGQPAQPVGAPSGLSQPTA